MKWETFSDASYYDMWCVRPVGERRFGHSFHLINGEEAKGLREFLEAQAAEMIEQARIIGMGAERELALRAEIERLREALEPFAKSGDLLVMAEDKGDFWAYRPAGGDEYGITGRHLLAARAALGEPTGE